MSKKLTDTISDSVSQKISTFGKISDFPLFSVVRLVLLDAGYQYVILRQESNKDCVCADLGLLKRGWHAEFLFPGSADAFCDGLYSAIGHSSVVASAAESTKKQCPLFPRQDRRTTQPKCSIVCLSTLRPDDMFRRATGTFRYVVTEERHKDPDIGDDVIYCLNIDGQSNGYCFRGNESVVKVPYDRKAVSDKSAQMVKWRDITDELTAGFIYSHRSCGRHMVLYDGDKIIIRYHSTKGPILVRGGYCLKHTGACSIQVYKKQAISIDCYGRLTNES